MVLKKRKRNVLFVFVVKNDNLYLLIKTIKLKITFLYEDTLKDPKLISGFGFSCLIETIMDGFNKSDPFNNTDEKLTSSISTFSEEIFDKKILFDIGGNIDILFQNIKNLNINLNTITHLVFSHHHWDHTDGFVELIQKLNRDCIIYLPYNFDKRLLKLVNTKNQIIINKEFLNIDSNIYLLTLKARTNLLKDCFSIYEQNLIINTSKGLVIFTGCAHAGIVPIIKKIKDKFKKDIYYVIGGFHLKRNFSFQIKNIINQFNLMDIKNVIPCHCSGEKAKKLFTKNFDNQTLTIGTGSIVNI
ncbi:MAG: MBL fold metallo-hydrolase [Bacteroidetes bacterium]|nr:MBL fold metallo-hydrolase [Bacteroidota bacterium]